MEKKLRLGDIVLATVKTSNGQEVNLYATVCRVLVKEEKVVVRLFDGGYFTLNYDKIEKKTWAEVK
jgi:hypothetical protein